MRWNNAIRAVRHKIWVKNNFCGDVPSRTGRDVYRRSSFYPYFIPNGMEANTISENYRGLAL